MGEISSGSLETTPTWAVAVFTFVFFFLAFIIETSLHHLTKFLRRRKFKSFKRALGKIKMEMMKMGFISLLLAFTEASIPNICVTKRVSKSFLPCRDIAMEASMESVVFASTRTPVLNSDQTDHCESKGMVSLMSREGVSQLNILISLLAVFHVLYCMFTMCLGIAKIRKWKAWEKETRALDYQMDNDPRRFRLTSQTSIGRRHLNFYATHPLLVWPVCFIRQFSGSVSKSDYFTLRNGFITSNIAGGSEFNFQKFVHRAFDHDFVQVIQIRFWIWIFSILFIFFSAHEFYNHYWLPFIPLVIVVTVGTKLQVIITTMCVESSRRNPISQGEFTVKPHDQLFWFSKPNWLLYLIQFVLIQNSFQLAFFTWTWFEFGVKSCFNRRNEDIAIRLGMGVGVQLLCGYVTLPLYALVTQMGSSLKRTVFTDDVVDGLKNWKRRSKQRLSNKPSSSTRYSKSMSFHSEHRNSLSHSSGREISLVATAEERNSTRGRSNSEGCDEEAISCTQREKCKVGMRSNYDGEISFASTWKELEIKMIGEGAYETL
ncbi:MLO-like protein 12 [Cucurbita pepo subsp. pepo]|uniref:MLO-like protein 12 n=1 Tax=Cucurbita pepo subsp. pepo TaxID=3664 RepID=UPI000C9D55D9|nr:MLO-like protein 12 [Cucurbita pepo subsp. pepo]